MYCNSYRVNLKVYNQKFKRKQVDKDMSHDIQNEIISIIEHQVQKDIVNDISGHFFSIIADEYTDISNHEQLSICL